MSLVSGKLNQTATYWAFCGVDSAGDLEYDPPVQISVRWEDGQETFFSIGGEERKSRVIVYVDQDLLVRSYLFLGTSASVTPNTVVAAFRIEAFLKEPSLNASEFVRRALI